MFILSKKKKNVFYWKQNLIICLFGSFTTFLAMTLILPFLSIYIKQLGINGEKNIAQWSGIVYASTFITAALVAPLWGYFGDRYGRKPMLLRASFGMTISMALMGCVSNIWQLTILRLIIGLAAGYSSGSTIMIAAQAPREQSSWALGLLSSGVMAGNLMGPFLGGLLPNIMSIRMIFIGAAFLIFITFLMTLFFIYEAPVTHHKKEHENNNLEQVSCKSFIIIMLLTSMLLMIANMSIEPIITLYIQRFEASSKVTFFAGLAMSVTALGSILSASWLGKIADKKGSRLVIVTALLVAGILLFPQAFVTSAWQLVILRFFMGLALGGIMPCIIAVIKNNVAKNNIGMMLGYAFSSQNFGQVVGPLLGGWIGGHIGFGSIFFITGSLLIFCALLNWSILKRSSKI